MKIFKQALLAPIAVALFTLGCTNDDNVPPSNEVNPVEIPAAISDGSSRFALNFLHNLQKSQPGEDNLFVSPLSLHMAMGMLLNGAENESAAEIQKALEMQGISLEDLNKTYSTLIRDLPVADSRVTLGLANSVWYKNGLNVETSFQNVLKESFQAEITGLPFNDASKDRINKWASDKTNGKIKNVIQNIEPDHIMFLLNALYFKADWKASFDPKETIDMPFKLENGSSKTVKMMHIKSAFKVAGGTSFSAVRLPYGNGQFTMTLLLPTASNTIDQVLSEIDADKWKSVINGTAENNVKVGLPRFTLDYSAKLNGTLQQMGISKVFSNAAEFGKITKSMPLKVDFVKQDAYLAIDEKGTEAAAVTSIGIVPTSSAPQEPTFICDRPFGLIISENTSNTILFMGRIKNPDSK